MLILGIDPGLESIGYGVVRKVGSKIEAVDYGLIKTPRILIPERLKLIHDGVVELIEKHHPEQGYRSCLGLMRLARTFSRERMEAACTRALAIGTHRYRSVASILKKGLDRQPIIPPAQAELPLPSHANVRGPDYYH